MAIRIQVGHVLVVVLLAGSVLTTVAVFGPEQGASAASVTPNTPICRAFSGFASELNAIITHYNGAGSRSDLQRAETSLGNYWKSVTKNLPSDLEADAAKVMPIYRQVFNVWLKEGGTPHWLDSKHASLDTLSRELSASEKPVTAYDEGSCSSTG